MRSKRQPDGRTLRWGYLTPTGEETNDEAAAATDEQGNPVQNQARNLWVTATALTTALNTAFLAERMALFAIFVGVALLLTGIGFLVLTMGGALRAPAAPMSPTN
jgi:hypothetical protein